MNTVNRHETERLHGFSLQSVCWGYREIFASAIEELLSDGTLGDERRPATDRFFDLLKSADTGTSDHVLKEFVMAINPRTKWMMDLPAVFSDVTEMGSRFAAVKPYFGMGYFKTLGSGGFGKNPEQVRSLMTHLRQLSEIDWEVAFAFLQGYRRLAERLSPAEIRLYVAEGLRMFTANKEHGLGFMRVERKSSENVIRALTRECRLEDVRPALTRLIKALVGYEVEISDLGSLDSDELIERGSGMVCLYRWLYLPACVRYFERTARNREWYVLTAVVAAGMLLENSFSRIHGAPEYSTCRDLVGEDPVRLNLLQILEYVRVLRRIKTRWPGAVRLLDWAMRTEFDAQPAVSGPDRLLYDAVLPRAAPGAEVAALWRLADRAVNVFDTAALLSNAPVSALVHAYSGLDAYPLRAFRCLPDFLYPGTVSSPPPGELIADLKSAADKRQQDERSEKKQGRVAARAADSENETDEQEQSEKQAEQAMAGFVYDEWNHAEHDYYQNWCVVREIPPRQMTDQAVPEDVFEEAQRIRRVFERFKPDLVRREKYLADGDVINIDLLVHYLVKRRMEPHPRIDFYEKPRINRRDLAVLLLLDISGSTGAESGQQKIVELEKRAALILAYGLASLGDRFAICGFSGNGRKNCEYYTFKDFEEEWNAGCVARILAAYPLSSTRIGAALRHSGYRLTRIDARQRLIILITDGQPMDSEYDPKTRYAQYDVRTACEENRKQEIHTFCISTEENSRADMEIMFPGRRFVILPDMRQLPRVLPRLYLHMTT
ncbi:MAG: VWA domain-containing protein [Kiritimatiellae bacterium]|nr:VWA domain-containing protein [Kiritimatiellia bacterium]